MNPPAGTSRDANGEAGFRAIFREFAPRIYQQAFRVLGDADEAAEAVQEVFLKVHRSLDRFRGDSSLATWIYRITFNTLASYRRARRSQQLPVAGANEAMSLQDDECDVAAAYERKESHEQLARCIARLSPREAVAITLFYMDGFDYKEIASVMGTSVGSVGLLLHRGREHLHVLLTGKKEVRQNDL
ncbi:MAG TPA: RNA polymerase sigma factor [Bacteroidota bacterium]|nr:RNA polymerase sigma factor [Bacteroidota bacterium]